MPACGLRPLSLLRSFPPRPGRLGILSWSCPVASADYSAIRSDLHGADACPKLGGVRVPAAARPGKTARAPDLAEQHRRFALRTAVVAAFRRGVRGSGHRRGSLGIDVVVCVAS